MAYILGIDTGGTNTDSVLLDMESKELICSGKAFTTRHHLQTGIKNAIDMLPQTDYENIQLVTLSTTLATNAIVESKGCKTGLLLSGAMPDRPLPAERYQLLSGKLDIRGREKATLSETEIIRAVNGMKDQVEAFAISGYASVRNPSHELKIKAIVEDLCCLPVFCAHQITGSLGYWERTVTTVLNASLIQIVQNFILATRQVLSQKNIAAPIMIVRGDGTLMNEAVALDRPIETILSGPAASMLGAQHLTGLKDAFILDMGGTTTDIADLVDGTVRLNKEGAKVGGWLTRCQAAEVSTFGIGGDSRISVDAAKKIHVGPQKAKPLSVACADSPSLLRELHQYRKTNHYTFPIFNQFDCFALSNPGEMVKPDCPVEKKLISLLQDGPHSLLYLAAHLENDAETLPLKNLLKEGLIQLITFTPTDLLHADGSFTQWNTDAAGLALDMLCRELGCSYDHGLEKIRTEIVRALVLACIQSAADFEHQGFSLYEDSTCLYLLDKAFSQQSTEFLNALLHLKKPIIAVGGPVPAWMPAVADKLDTKLVIPDHWDVANAVGAAVAKFSETAEALIRPVVPNRSYVLFLPHERVEFDSYDSALACGKQKLTLYIKEKMSQYGLADCPVEIDVNEVYTKIFSSSKRTYVETRLTGNSCNV